MIWLILISAGVVTFITLFLVALYRSDISDRLWKLMGNVVCITVLVFALGFFISFCYTSYTVSPMTEYSEQATLEKTENLENLQTVTENNSSICGNIFCFYGKDNSEYYYSIMKWENDYLVTDKIKSDDVKVKYTDSEEIPHIDTYEYREYEVEKTYNKTLRYLFDFIFVFVGEKESYDVSLSSKFAYYVLYIPKDSILNVGYNFEIR